MTNIGNLRVYAIRNGKEDFYNVTSPEEAQSLISSLADADLKNEAIEFNCFGLLVYEGISEYSEDGWVEWRNEDGYSLDEIEREV